MHGFDWTAVTVFKSDGSLWAMNEVIVPGQLAQLCVVPGPVPTPCPGKPVSSEGFPGILGQGPLQAGPECVSDTNAASRQVCLYVPKSESSMSGPLPSAMSPSVLPPAEMLNTRSSAPSEACSSDVSVLRAGNQGSPGECGPLPFKLPTDVSRPMHEVPSMTPQEKQMEIDMHPDKAKDALPALEREAGVSVSRASEAGQRHGPGHADSESGPLPCQLPADGSPLAGRSIGTAVHASGHIPVTSGGSITQHGFASPRVNNCPMVFLDADGLMRLDCSYTTTQEALQSMLSQVVTAQDRCMILEHQGLVWADDELRWHLVALLMTKATHASGQAVLDQCAMIDPLLMAGWVATAGENCEIWVNQYCTSPRVVATIALVQNHWVPIVLIPRDQVLHVHTWDSPTVDHTCLEPIFAKLDSAMGLSGHQTARLYRMFPMNEGCGVMAVAFIAYMLHDRMLPTTPDDVHAFHTLLRAKFIEAVQTHETCTKPWKWANGAPQCPDTQSSAVGRSPVAALRCEVTRATSAKAQSFVGNVAVAPSKMAKIGVMVMSLFASMPVGSFLQSLGIRPSTWGFLQDEHGEASEPASVSHVCAQGPCHSPVFVEPRRVPHAVHSTSTCLSESHVDVQSPCLPSPTGVVPAAQLPSAQHAHVPDEYDGECGPLPCLMPTKAVHRLNTGAPGGGESDILTPPLPGIDMLSEGWHVNKISRTIASQMPHESESVDSSQSAQDQCQAPCKGYQPGELTHTAGAALPVLGECGPLPFKLPTDISFDVQMIGEAGTRPGDLSFGGQSVQGVATMVGRPLVSLQTDELLTWRPVSSVPDDGAQSLLAQKMSVIERRMLLEIQGYQWADDEIRWYLDHLLSCLQCSPIGTRASHNWATLDPLIFADWIAQGGTRCATWVLSQCPLPDVVITVAHVQHHWIPIVMVIGHGDLQFHTWDHPASDHASLDKVFTRLAGAMNLPGHTHVQWPREVEGEGCCGSLAVAFLAHIMFDCPLPRTHAEVLTQHASLRAHFLAALETRTEWIQPRLWASGLATQAEQELTPVLIDHGVPQEHAGTRAKAAVRAIGAQQVLDALGSRIPWKQLKTLGNQSKFQFLLPAELQSKVAAAAGKGAIGRPKGGKKSKKTPPELTPVSLDPAKFAISAGVFQSNSQPLQQKPLKAVGPATEGVVIVTKAEAAPYLAQGKTVSNLPLALLVLQSTLAEVTTSLPHQAVTVPCHCVVNQEPMLIDMIMVQIGSGHVEKTQASRKIHIDTVDVGTLRITVFRDEIEGTWDQLTQGPMKYVVHHFPLLRMCREPGCQCAHWHNHEKIDTKDALVDVWRRQYLRNGYKPEPPSSATMFAVSIRVPSCLVVPLLKLSGTAGIYAEPRSLDSRTVHEDYAIVWLTRLQPAALNHLCQTNPTAIGLARVGDRIGLRTLATHASELSKAVRPDAVYLPAGPKQQFLAGPFPFGTDRGSLTKALQQIDWEARPLQPLASIDNKGAMWLIQATDDPPASLLSMGHGDVMISKHKGPRDAKESKARPVATPATIALCNTQTSHTNPPDPWSTADPWGGYAPSSNCQTDASEGLKQLESKIQQAVLASLPASSNQMEVDDVPDRVQVLEQQMNTMMQKHAQLEATVTDHAARHTAQLGSVQHQLQTQGAELRGHIESQQQNLQALFESQMSQIRSLLKRPREDHE